MPSILSSLGTAFDLLLVVLGFGLIIFFHELGHFLAARWARIRVLAFAIGFGPALVSWRKGMGVRKGSSVAEYEKLAEERGLARPGRPAVVPGISPTEYRLNILPFGGYVKMLGQEDADPTARSDEPDGYQSAPVWKRMVVISAGVVANFIVAAILFIIVFMAGLKTEPPIIGGVEPGSPAATVVANNATALGVTDPGLQPGDRVLTIDADAPDDFSAIVVATAMARKGREIRFVVQRVGVSDPLVFDITPRVDPVTKLLQIGVGPAVSATIVDDKDPEIGEQVRKVLNRSGLGNVAPGARLVRVGDDAQIASAYDLDMAARRSGGAPFDVVFVQPGAAAQEVTVAIQPERRLPRDNFWPAKDRLSSGAHVLGLMPLLRVEEVLKDSPAAKAGVHAGDLFAQLGDAEWPSYPEGIAEVRANAGGKVRVVVLRETEGVLKEVDLGEIAVTRDGTIGFYPGESTDTTHVTAWPRDLAQSPTDVAPPPVPPAASLALMRGSRIVRVNDTPVSTFEEIAAAIAAATKPALDSGEATARVSLALSFPVGAAGGEERTPGGDIVEWTIPRAEFERLHTLAWASPVPTILFEREEITLKAANPARAISMGISRTHRVMMQTYLTFSRLFQGSVKVEHLKGPVGIAHLGTMVASRGFVHLLFFMALISVNLGVVNFLPIPIADGGHFVFLVYEQITGKPVSVAVQNIAALAGLILMVGMFLLVTYNDIANIFG